MTEPGSSISEYGWRIRRIRIARDWTVEELAKHVGVSKQAVSKVERGEHGLSVESLMIYARVFGIPVSWLLGEQIKMTALVKMGLQQRSDYLAICDIEAEDPDEPYRGPMYTA